MTDSASPDPHDDSTVARVLAVAGTRVVLLVLGTAVSVVIARALGPGGRGQYAFAVAVAGTAVSLAHASVEQAQVYLTSTGTAVRQLASNAIALSAALGAAAVVAVSAASKLLDYPSAELTADTPLLLALAAVPLNIAVLYLNNLLVLSGRTDLLNRGMLLAGVAQCGLVMGAAAADRLTVTVVVAAWLLNAALPLAVSLPALRPSPGAVSWALARQELHTGLRYHGGLASLYLLMRIDVLLLAAMRSDADVGLYALAVSLIELTNIATDAVATVVVRRQVTDSLADSATFTARVIGLTAVLAAAAAAALVLAGWLLIPTVYGEDFSGSVPALVALAPGVVALAAVRSAGGYLIRLDRPWTVTALAVGALGVNVVLNLLLIPDWGIVGAGVATSIAYALLATSHVTWMRRAAGIPLGAFRPVVPRRSG